MNLDEYRDRLATLHRQFTDSMMATCGRTQTFFIDLVRDVDRHVAQLKESNEESRRLILEQGEQLRALRARLDGGNSH